MNRLQKTDTMTSRRRFRETMGYGQPDRVPYFEEGIRKEVVEKWRGEGLSGGRELARRFPTDKRERIELDLSPHPEFKKWPVTMKDLRGFKDRLAPYDRGRFPNSWKKRVKSWQNRDHVLIMHVHRGLFLTMGVKDWKRFLDVMYLLADEPGMVHDMMTIQGEFSAALVEQALNDIDIDAAVFSEPIGGNDGPLISPKMYEEIVLQSYQPLMDVLQRNNVETIIFQTFANARILIPSILKFGFNCLWACEVNIDAMDYRSIRREYGKDLKLIGGIDLDALRKSREEIRKEIERKVPPLLAQGGYVPLADGRIREDVPFENYVYYRELLEKVTTN